MKEYFQLIANSLPLLPKHREELKTKRGFTDEVIDRLGFKSCNKELAETPALASLPDSLRKSLYYENILIPYTSPENEIVHLRPHKFGFEDAGIAAYVPWPLIRGKEKDVLVLAESEFKAVASCLLGVPAIGVPGISSMSGKYLDDLCLYVEMNCIGSVVVCFDNEVKDDPRTKNFKADYTKRYDSQIYSYLMAYKIGQKTGLKTFVATLHDEWREDNKADIDGILARGITPEQYQACIKMALKPSDYLHRLKKKMPRSHHGFLRRKIDDFLYKDSGLVKEDWGCYYTKEIKKNDVKWNKISNFVIRVSHTIQEDKGSIRHAQFLSEYGNSPMIRLEAEHMASRQAFLKLCYESGDYEFDGTEADMREIWKMVFRKQSGKIVKRLTAAGYDSETCAWFFSNGAYKDGNYYPKTEDGIVWMEEVGYILPDTLEGGKDIGLEAPMLAPEATTLRLQDLWHNVSQILGEDMAKLILGWAIGHFFLPEIDAKYKVYPFLFFYGKAGAGKTTIVNWICSLFGYEQKGTNFGGNTAVGIQRATSLLSMLPLWLEEYRTNDDAVIKKNNYLRTIYDKTASLKGTKMPGEIKSYVPKSTIILSGQEYPKDDALNSRCILVPMFRTPDKSDQYDWMQNNKTEFAALGHKIMLARKELWPKLEAKIDEYLNSFRKQSDISPRTRIHFSIIGGICDIFFGVSTEFHQFVGAMSFEHESERKSESAMSQFWDDMYYLWGSGELKFDPIKLLEDNQVAAFFQGCYSAWELKYKTGRQEIPASRGVLTKQIRSEPWFVDSRPIRLNGKTVSCYVFKADHESLPQGLQELVKSFQAREDESRPPLDQYSSRYD